MKTIIMIMTAAVFALSFSASSFAGTKVNCKGTFTDYERSNCERRNATDRDTPAEAKDRADDGKVNGSTGKGARGSYGK